MPPPSSPYRDGRDAVRTRLLELQSRLREVDVQMTRHRAGLSPVLWQKLIRLRDAAEPASENADDVFGAERDAARLEREMDEALGLAAELHRTVNSVLPAPAIFLRWASMSALACVLLVAGVVQLGLGDFMLQAFGVKLLRVHPTIPSERVAYEARRASREQSSPSEQALLLEFDSGVHRRSRKQRASTGSDRLASSSR